MTPDTARDDGARDRAEEIAALKAQLAESERRGREASARLARLEGTIGRKEALARTVPAAVAEATRIGFVYPDIIPKLLDLSHGDPDRAVEQVTRFAEEHPGMLTAKPHGGTPPRPGVRSTGGHRPGREAAAIEAAKRELWATGRYHGAM